MHNDIAAITFVVVVLGIWFAPAIICAIVASNKGRSGLGWFFLGVMFSWLAVLVAAAMSREAIPQPQGARPRPRQEPWF